MGNADSGVEAMAAAEQESEPAPRLGGETASPPASVGAILREAREQCGLSVFEVAEKLFLTEHYVRSLEADNYEKLPSEVYVKGYIRSYALLLGIDVEQVMGAYRRPGAPPVGDPVPMRAPPPGSSRKWVLRLLLLLLVGAVAAAAWWAYQTYGAGLELLAVGAAKRGATGANGGNFGE